MLRISSLGAVVALAALLAAPAAPATASTGPDAAAHRAEIERWKGRTCVKPGCARPPASPWSHAAAFGASVLAVGTIARRRAGDSLG